MSENFVIPGVPDAAPRLISRRPDHDRCFIVFFLWVVSTRAVSWSLALLACLILADARGADERLQAAEHRALISAANTESAYLQRANVQLIAPEVQHQIQSLADEISLAAGSGRHFKVFIFNESFLSTQSSANGDIFLPTSYLDMAEDRDELAFGLAREIAMQVKDLRLKEMKQSLQNQRSQRRMNLVFDIVISSVVGAVYGRYALSPINSAIYRNTATPQWVGLRTVAGKAPVGVNRGPGGLISAPPPSGPQLEPVGGPDFQAWGSAQQATGVIRQFVDWVPNLITSKIEKITSHIVSVAYEEADPERRKLKNDLGLEFMQMAGYNSASALKVIKKLDDFWAKANATNAPTTNAIK